MKSAFFGLDITGAGPWPGYPERPRETSWGDPLDPGSPIQYQGNPVPYYKWMRIIPSSGVGWMRTLFLPPGESTPLAIDRAINSGHEAVSAWSLLIRQPECEQCVISTYKVQETRRVTKSRLQRSHLKQIINCQVTDFPEAEESTAEPLETWSMSQGSVLFDSGYHYFKIVNTSDQPQILCSIASFEPRDIKDIITARSVNAHLPYSIHWANK